MSEKEVLFRYKMIKEVNEDKKKTIRKFYVEIRYEIFYDRILNKIPTYLSLSMIRNS